MEKSRNNSRRLMAIIAVVLMVCLILAMGAVTFAKYITSESSTATATAAKWGYVITANATDLFPTDYTATAEGTLAVKATGDGVSVNAESATLAPGTTGSMDITISGSAEVLAQLKITGSVTSEIHVGAGDSAYYPVKWTLKKGDETIGTSGKLSEVLGTAVTDDIAISTTSATITYTLSWEWALETGDTTEAKAANNAKDTAIGKKANDNTYTDSALGDIVATMSFNLTISVEQIQTTSD